MGMIKKFFMLLVVGILVMGCNKESSDNISGSISGKTTLSNDAYEMGEILTDNAKYLDIYDESKFRISSKAAMSYLIDALMESERWQENFKLICSRVMLLNEESYYQITVNTENEMSYSDIGIFCINATSGKIYLKFDPTLDTKGYFSEFVFDIPEDDERTRLIPMSLNG